MEGLQIIHTAAGEELVVLQRAQYEALLARANETIVDAKVIEETEDLVYEPRKDARANAEADVLPKEVSVAMLRGDSRLKAIRRWKGVTQLQLSQKTGVSQGYLSDLENGHRAGAPETIAKIAEILDIPVAWLALPEAAKYPPATFKPATPEHRTPLEETSLVSRRPANRSALSPALREVLQGYTAVGK